MWGVAWRAVVVVGTLLVGASTTYFRSEPEAQEDGRAIEAAYCEARPQDCHDAGGGTIHIYQSPCFIDVATGEMWC